MDIKNEIKEAFTENKRIFAMLLIIFIMGFVIADIFADDIAPQLMPLLKEAMLGDNATSIDAVNILIHNEKSAITILLTSVFFGISAILSMFANGFAIGFMAGYTIKSTYDLAIYIALIIPHGILEIPAFFSNCTSGILLFLFVFRTLKDKIHENTFKEAYENNKKTLKHVIILFVISITLFAIAAFIEGFITPQIGNMVSLQLNGTSLF